MKHLLCLSALAVGLFAALTPETQAQTVTFNRGGVRYNGYGQGYYGGYGRGYNGYNRSYHRGYNRGYNGYVPRGYGYTGYGNGPYGYGSGSSRMFPSYGGYGYGNTNYYNGYSYSDDSGIYGTTYLPVYSPIGFGVYNSYGW